MSQKLIAACARLVSRAGLVIEHHPRHVTAVLAAVLFGGGGGAFAVASFGPDPAQLPVRQVLETVDALPSASQLEAIDLQALRLHRADSVRSTDTVDSLLARLGISDADASAYLRSDHVVRTMLLGRGGRQVRVEANGHHGLERLTARWLTPGDGGNFERLVVERAGSGQWSTRVETAALEARARLGSGTIRSSLFAATDDADIGDEVAVQIADILAGRIDFHRGLRRGDVFSVVYESLEADGEPLRTGRVLSVSFTNNGKTHAALWFQQPGRKGAYFAPDGASLQSMYLTSPMEFSRVTSGFANRFHPILREWRQHLGVDYAAPTGTPVRTVGDGVIEFAGWQNGFGNVVMVRHQGPDVTVYAHLSRIDVRVGQTVAQGQRVGAVGATGWATGPHLHFEFRVNGRHQDPLAVARRSEGMRLTAELRPAFEQTAREMIQKLDAAAQLASVASID